MADKVTMKQGHLYRTRKGEVFWQKHHRLAVGWMGDDCRDRNDAGVAVANNSGHDAVADLGPAPTWAEVVAMREEVERLEKVVYEACLHVMPGLENTPDAVVNLVGGCRRLVESEQKYREECERLRSDNRIHEAARVDLKKWRARLNGRDPEVGRDTHSLDYVTTITYQVDEIIAERDRLRIDLQSMAANRDDLLQRNTELEAENGDLRAKLAKEAATPDPRTFADAKPSTYVDLSGRKIPPIPEGWRLVTDYAEEPHPEAEIRSSEDQWVQRPNCTGRYKTPSTYIVPIAYDTPIPWHGGPCPVAPNTWLDIQDAYGEICSGRADWFDWSRTPDNSGITFYTVPAPKPAEPDLAAVEKPDMLRELASEPAWHERPTGGESVVYATWGMGVREERKAKEVADGR